jgi:hypothetical protein
MEKPIEPIPAVPQRDPVDRQAQPAASAAGSFGDYDPAGVDLSLLRWVLSLPPLERLKLMERHARDPLLLYEYGRRHREARAGPHR